MKATQIHQTSDERTFAVIFETGDEAIAGLTGFAKERGITAARLTAIGGFQDVILGYFEWQKKDYKKLPLREQVEVLSLLGDVALDEKGLPKVHAHVVLGRSDASTLGGHLLEGHVRPTLEVMLTESAKHLQRRYDAASGLSLIRP